MSCIPRTETGLEYIVEAGDCREMRSWLAVLHCCIKEDKRESMGNLGSVTKVLSMSESVSLQHLHSGARLDFLNSSHHQPVSLADLPPR